MSTSQTLNQLLTLFDIKDYDILLVGDGSGSTWNRPNGWGCISIEQASLERKVWYGASNAGSSNLAEIMAYLQPLMWFAHEQLKKESMQFKQVHIITDSAYLTNKGKSSDSRYGVDAAVWQSFSHFKSFGLNLHWHWAKRNSVELNSLADYLSKTARRHMEDLFDQEDLKQKLYSFNEAE